jgi:3',5'-cyclic AMP phosphodiesterase CpdA
MSDRPDGRDRPRATAPPHRLAHLSDTHLTAAGVRYNGAVDTDAALRRAVAVLREAGRARALDGVVVSGDVADTGDADAYRRARTELESLAVPLVWAPGNHDRREPFNEHLLDLPGRAAPVLGVHDVGGLRVVALDSTVPGAGQGRLERDHLGELREVLASPAPAGTIVVLHHPPIPAPSPLLDHFALDGESRDRLADALAASDVRLVLAGHHHLAQSGMFAGIPVAVAGSVAIRTDPLAAVGHEHTTRSASFNLVTVWGGTATTSVVPIDGAETVFDLDATQTTAIIARDPSRIR